MYELHIYIHIQERIQGEGIGDCPPPEQFQGGDCPPPENCPPPEQFRGGTAKMSPP